MSRKNNSQSLVDAKDSLLCVGEIKSAYGIKGWLWVFSYTDPIEQLFDYAPWSVQVGSGLTTIEIESWRKQGKGIVVKLAGVTDRTVAETYCHTKLYINSTDLPEPADDEYYWSELVGMQVVSDTGDVLGVVSSLSETPAHQILEVSPCNTSADNETRLIPWHETTILDVDKNDKVITVDWQLDY